MKIVKRSNASIRSRYDGPMQPEEFDFERFEPGDIVIGCTTPHTIQIVRDVRETASPYSDALRVETLWNLDPSVSLSTRKTVPSTRYRLATRSEVQDAIKRLEDVLLVLK